jgi:hypothetical protein
VAASVWRELSALPSGEKLLDRYGLVAARWAGAERSGRAVPSTWLLDRKGFRRALALELPPSHGVVDIAGDKAPARRASRAARAFDRTLGAARQLLLPELGDAQRVLVWTSPVIRPRGIELPLLVHEAEVVAEPQAVREAIGRLWAVVYFEECLRRVREHGLRRVEVATGLSVLRSGALQSGVPESDVHASDGSDELETARELLQVKEPPRTVVSVPGRLTASSAEAALSLSLGVADERGLERALADRFRRVPAGLIAPGPGRWELNVEKLAHWGEPRTRVERRALECLIGAGRGLGALSTPSRAPSRLALSRTVGREIMRQGTLAVRVAAHQARVREADTALGELDLAVLPDDGLKRTLEDAARLWTDNAELGSEALLSSELLVASSEELDGDSALRIDAGHEGLAWLAPLSTWQARLEVVRHDAACCEALVSGAPLPEGAGRRALLEAERLLAHFGPDPLLPRDEVRSAGDQESSPWLRGLARLALRPTRSVATACREARFAADRRLAVDEARRSSLLGLSLAAVRSLTRDAVSLREQVRADRLVITHLLGRIAADVDRRLRRIEPALPAGAAYDCTLEELVEAVDLRGSSLVARVQWRRAERQRQSERRLPWWSPLSEVVGSGTAAEPGESAARSSSGEPLSLGEVAGAALWSDTTAPMGAPSAEAGGPVLVAETFTPALLLALPFVSGFLARHGARADSFAVVARALGVPGALLRELPTDGGAFAPEEARVMLRVGSRGASVRWELAGVVADEK